MRTRDQLPEPLRPLARAGPPGVGTGLWIACGDGDASTCHTAQG